MLVYFSTFNTQRILLYLDLVDHLELEFRKNGVAHRSPTFTGIDRIQTLTRTWIQTLQLVVSEVQPASRRRRF